MKIQLLEKFEQLPPMVRFPENVLSSQRSSSETPMNSQRVMRYLQFYAGIAIAAIALFLLKNETAMTLSVAVFVFFALRIASVPLAIILMKMIKEPKHSIFGIDNQHVFGGLALLMGIATICAILFKASSGMICMLMVFTMMSLDTAFSAKMKK